MKELKGLTKGGKKRSRKTKSGTKTKVCSYCGKRKYRDKFVTGRMCKTCKIEYDEKRYLEKKDEIDSRMREYGKTERGYEVNRGASLKYGRSIGRGKVTNRAETTRVWYAKLKEDPEAYERHLYKCRAQSKVAYAIKTSKLVRGPCEVCGSTNVHAHHDDYDKPLEVRWLCSLHHGITRRLEEYLLKATEHKAIRHALRTGTLVKKDCFVCQATKNIEGYCENYNEPFKVIWLCEVCYEVVQKIRFKRQERG